MPDDNQTATAPEIRILVIDLSRRYGGASVRALTVADHMQPGFVAIAGLENSPVLKIAEERNIPTRIVGKHRLDPLIPFRLRKIILEERVQIIDTQNIQSKFWGSLTALITDVAFVVTLNSSYEDEQGRALKGKFYAFLDRWTNFRTNRYIAVSDPIQKSLIKAGISSDLVDLVSNAVEGEDTFQSYDPKQTRREIGIPDDGFVCVSVGRLVWAKGFDDFIAAFASITDRNPNLYALILGDGVLYPALTRQIKEAGLENKFFLTGHCKPEKVNCVLKASDVFVLSSRSEGVPFAVLEAGAVGLPIISTRCGGIPEILTDNVDALLVPVGDIQAIASGIEQLVENPQLAQRLGSTVKETIRRNHGIPKLIEATRNAYQKALEHKRML